MNKIYFFGIPILLAIFQMSEYYYLKLETEVSFNFALYMSLIIWALTSILMIILEAREGEK